MNKELLNNLWFDFADCSGGNFKITMSYEAFVAAMNKYTAALRAQEQPPQTQQH